MRAWWLLVVVGCTSSGDVANDAAIDAAPPPPLHYTLGVDWHWPAYLPEPASRPTVYIDGEPRELLEVDYANVNAAEGERHFVELRYDAILVAMWPITIRQHDFCGEDVPDAFEMEQYLCAVPTGELRYSSDSLVSNSRGCAGDGGCFPRCQPDTEWACADKRCTSIYSSLDPIATHLGCAPIGLRGVGESCSLVTSYAGIHDNCGDKLVCVAGTCRQICGRSTSPEGCTSCEHLSGHAPEMLYCP